MTKQERKEQEDLRKEAAGFVFLLRSILVILAVGVIWIITHTK